MQRAPVIQQWHAEIQAQDQPLVSVVIPVYNTEKYLAEAIESVIGQTYEHWELALLDNCSTDGTLEIALEHAERDPRIRVIEGGAFVPVVQNWNRALGYMSPQSVYCKIVCADDWLYPDCLMRMVALAERHPSVSLVGAYRLDELSVNLDGLPHEREVYDGRELARRCLLGGIPYLWGSPTSTLLRTDVVRSREPFYTDDNLHADNDACYYALSMGDFGFVHQVLTFTRRHNEAVTPYAKRLNTYLPGQLLILATYGPMILDTAEYERRLATMTARYVRYLVAHPLRMRDAAFVDFHRPMIRRVADRVSMGQLGRGTVNKLIDLTARVGGTGRRGHRPLRQSG